MPIKKKKSKKKANGRPPKYSDAEALHKGINAYFKSCAEAGNMPNKAGLCIWLNISRDTYNEYKKSKFPDAIKVAEAYIENSWVQRLASTAPTGAIFYLKNAFSADYRERVETDVTSGGERVQGFQLIAPHDRQDTTHK